MVRRLLAVCLALAALFGSAAPACASVASFGVGVLTTVGHYVNIGWKYSFTAADAGHTYRLYFVYQFWHTRSGPDQLLFTSTRATPAC